MVSWAGGLALTHVVTTQGLPLPSLLALKMHVSQTEWHLSFSDEEATGEILWAPSATHSA